ncbi:MAG: class IV adenylate cyclase [Archaeoglobus sp.]|nr:class IV adenylate cyclase [Archaeoglobus sp.]
MEIEAKFRLENAEEVERKVEEFAEFVIDKIEEDIYFSFSFRDFSKTDEAVRIRRDVEGVTLAYKGPKIDRETKAREEIKVRIFSEDYENAIAFLEKLGLRKFAKVKKRRKIYRKDNVLICLDSLEGLGDFIEIEVESPNLDTAKEEIFRLAKTLGVSESLADSIRKSYLELLVEKGLVG